MNRVGRPTEYKPEILEKAKEYIKNLPGDEVIHSIEGLAGYLDISRETVRRWANDDEKEEFYGIVEKVLQEQAKTLANKGLKGEFNSSITKLLLTKHGYSDKQELTGAEGQALKITFDPIFNAATRIPENSRQESSPIQDSEGGQEIG